MRLCDITTTFTAATGYIWMLLALNKPVNQNTEIDLIQCKLRLRRAGRGLINQWLKGQNARLGRENTSCSHMIRSQQHFHGFSAGGNCVKF